LLQPPRRGRGLAGGAVAIAAGIVGDLLMPALGAAQDVTSQGRRAAASHVLQGAASLRCQFRSVLLQELVETTPDDLGHGGPRSRHDCGTSPEGRSSRSSGLRVDRKAAVATWRYRAVVPRLRWPRRIWMVRRSVPSSSRWVAKLWRRVWTVTCLSRPQ